MPTEADDQGETHLWYAALGQLIDEVVWVHRADRTIAFVSPSVEAVLGYTVEEFTEMATPALIHSDDMADVAATAEWLRAEEGRSYRSTLRILKADGDYLWAEVIGRNLLHDPDVDGVLNTLRDISDRRALEDELVHQASHDSLTGLPNRSRLIERIGTALASDPAGSTALLYIDLDGFKAVNDTHGHEAGDELLKVVAKRLDGVVRGQDLAGRLGGDEFLVLCHGINDIQAARVVAQRVHDSVTGPTTVAGGTVDLQLSIGMARASRVSTTELLMHEADQALYAAKRAGGNQVRFGPRAPGS